jgi:hypothetical protein
MYERPQVEDMREWASTRWDNAANEEEKQAVLDRLWETKGVKPEAHGESKDGREALELKAESPAELAVRGERERAAADAEQFAIRAASERAGADRLFTAPLDPDGPSPQSVYLDIW